VAEIIKASGKKVYKTQIINDRGIHICKSIGLAKLKRTNARIFRFKRRCNYYVVLYKEEIAQLMSAGKTEEEAKNKSDYSGSPRYATKMGIW
jgi:arginyl-tRNA synthetase